MEYFVPPDESQKWFDYWLAERMRWYLELGIPADKLRLRHHEQSELSHYSRGHGRRRVPLPLGLGRARGHRQPGRLRPHRPRQGLGGVARLLRPADQRALHAVRDRAGRRRHPDHDGLPARRLRRGRGRGRGPHRAAPALAAGALPGGRAPAVEEGHARAAGPPGARHACSRTSCATTTSRRASGKPLPAPGRGGDAVVRHGRLRLARGRRRHRARPRHHRAGPGPHRRPGRRAAPAYRARSRAAVAQATLRYLRTAIGARITSRPAHHSKAASHGAASRAARRRPSATRAPSTTWVTG